MRLLPFAVKSTGTTERAGWPSSTASAGASRRCISGWRGILAHLGGDAEIGGLIAQISAVSATAEARLRGLGRSVAFYPLPRPRPVFFIAGAAFRPSPIFFAKADRTVA